MTFTRPFQNHPDSLILQKYQSLSNQRFKHNLAHTQYLNVTPKLSFEFRFRMFVISVYYTKKQTIVILAILFFALHLVWKTCSLHCVEKLFLSLEIPVTAVKHIKQE